MNEKQIENMMMALEQLSYDVRNLTYAIKDLTDVNESLSLDMAEKQLKDVA